MTLSIQSPSTTLESRSYKCYTIRLTVCRHVCRGSFQNCPDSQCRITDTWYVPKIIRALLFRCFILVILSPYPSFCPISFVLSIIPFPLVKFGSNSTYTMSMGSDLENFPRSKCKVKKKLLGVKSLSRADFLTFNPLWLTYRMSINIRWAVTRTFLINP